MDKVQEIWRAANCIGRYEISNIGRIKSLYYNKIITPIISEFGYLRVQAYHKGSKKHPRVHRLVAMAFIPNPENKPMVNHKDGNKANNHVNNLEWVNSKENVLHSYKSGLQKPTYGNRKLMDRDVINIRLLSEDGLSRRQIKTIYGLSKVTIGDILTRKTWRHL